MWVLDAAYMPSVLIELGFLSNKTEGKFLNSNEGQTKMARQIADAIIHYKRKYFGTTESDVDSNKKDSKETVAKNNADATDLVYKVQIMASPKKMKLVPANFKGLKNISYEVLNKLYKYMYGETSSFQDAKEMQAEARKAGYLKAFIVKTKG